MVCPQLVRCHTHIALYHSKLITFQYWPLIYGNIPFNRILSCDAIPFDSTKIEERKRKTATILVYNETIASVIIFANRKRRF